MATTKLINKQDFKERVIITCCDFDNRVESVITLTQDRYLREVMTDELYFPFMERVRNKLKTSADEVLIEKYVKPYLVHQAYVELLVWDGATPSPVGLVERIVDDAEVLTPERRGALIATQRKHADFYRGELVFALKCEPWNLDTCCDKRRPNVGFSVGGSSRKKTHMSTCEYCGREYDTNCSRSCKCRSCQC